MAIKNYKVKKIFNKFPEISELTALGDSNFAVCSTVVFIYSMILSFLDVSTKLCSKMFILLFNS